MTDASPGGAGRRLTIGFAEFIVMIALMISITALSIDIMLPALPAIGDALGVADANRRQEVVIVFIIGFGSGQIVFGPLADRFGRRPPLLAGLGLCAIAAFACAFAPDFETLLAARLAQGIACAGPRVVVIAVVRDCFAGRAMARVMSLAMAVFIMVPIIAPSIGEAILRLASWEWIFTFIATIAVALLVWVAFRLDETSSPAHRRPLSLGGVARGFIEVATTRRTAGYGLCVGLSLGELYTYIATAQQTFVGIYDLGGRFPLAFGAVAGAMAIAFYANSRLVMRLGMETVSHGAACGMVGVCALLALIAAFGTPPLALYMVAMACFTFLFGLMVPNFNAMAMEPQGHIAGTASSLLGSLTTVGGALAGGLVGRAFDGTIGPLAIGFLILSVSVLATILVTERGRLFRSHP